MVFCWELIFSVTFGFFLVYLDFFVHFGGWPVLHSHDDFPSLQERQVLHSHFVPPGRGYVAFFDSSTLWGAQKTARVMWSFGFLPTLWSPKRQTLYSLFDSTPLGEPGTAGVMQQFAFLPALGTPRTEGLRSFFASSQP